MNCCQSRRNYFHHTTVATVETDARLGWQLAEASLLTPFLLVFLLRIYYGSVQATKLACHLFQVFGAHNVFSSL